MPTHHRVGFLFYLIGDFMNNQYIVTEIKSRLKMPEILAYYGFKTDRANRIPCPFHNGKDNNCGVKQDYIHCFVCDESADQIWFVRKYFNLDFIEAITKLNDDFNLCLPIGEKMSRRKQIDMAKRSYEMRKKREETTNEENRLRDNYYKALEYFEKLEKHKVIYKPKNESEELHPLFVEAIKNYELAKHRLECAEMELFLYEIKNRNNGNS